jgi:hypothetical protein
MSQAIADFVLRVIVALAPALFDAAQSSKDADAFARKLRGQMKLKVLKASRAEALRQFGLGK